jgi:hypothetical protein
MTEPTGRDIADVKQQTESAIASINASARRLYEYAGCPYGPSDDDMRRYLQDRSDETMAWFYARRSV